MFDLFVGIISFLAKERESRYGACEGGKIVATIFHSS